MQRLLRDSITQCRQIEIVDTKTKAESKIARVRKREGATRRLRINPRESATDVRGVLSVHIRRYTITAPCMHVPDLYSSHMHGSVHSVCYVRDEKKHKRQD